jgi:hypothetical protein
MIDFGVAELPFPSDTVGWKPGFNHLPKRCPTDTKVATELSSGDIGVVVAGDILPKTGNRF